MLKIVEIAKAWIAAANPSPIEQSIAEHRIKICSTCPQQTYNKVFDTYICGSCGCPLNKKIFSPAEGSKACPLQKWKY
jgi:ribosomal protein L37E